MYHVIVGVAGGIVFLIGTLFGSWLMYRDLSGTIDFLFESLTLREEEIQSIIHQKELAECKIQTILDVFKAESVEKVNCGWSKAGRMIPGYEACSREHNHEGPCAHALSGV